MRLVTGSSRFNLTVLGYQFPSLTPHTDPYDANWLMVKLHVNTDAARWTLIDPCLLTSELRALAEWLSRVAEREPRVVTGVTYGQRGMDALTFIEPNVAFSVADYPSEDSAVIRVHLSFVSLDGGSESDEMYGEHVDLELRRDAILEAVTALEADMQRYPERN